MNDENILNKLPHKLFRIAWPEKGVASFANNVTVQYDGEVFHVTFYQIAPPIMLEISPEEQKQTLEQADSIKALAVANLIITPPMLNRITKVFQDQINLLEKHSSNVTANPDT
jgi:hypothetical protein